MELEKTEEDQTITKQQDEDYVGRKQKAQQVHLEGTDSVGGQ